MKSIAAARIFGPFFFVSFYFGNTFFHICDLSDGVLFVGLLLVVDRNHCARESTTYLLACFGDKNTYC